ncbi:type VI secretion system membrane subunit TssM [Marinomonas sp. BSi20414]|uniref:type VI secretion system membrane subunit TssM n=1 Tax=Marinomonas sp. BSi20414 TaxID=388374 RepID=UPI0021C164B7|nr:type VI secretion system membrane subunit TssM [Marinomonas sp. BSi20414]
MRPYDKLIAQTQEGLGSLAIDQRVYRNLKQSAQTALGADINVRTLVGPAFNLVFAEREIGSDKLNVPKVLSKEGFKNYFLPQSESVSDLALIDSWVLGQNDTAQFSKADKQALKEKIRDSYVADYTNTWRSVLNEIDIKNFSNISEAVDVLDNLTGNGKPLQRLLTTLRDNTKLFPEIPEDGEVREEMLKSVSYNLASRLNAPFAGLNSIVEANNDQPAYIDELLLSIEQLRAYITAIQDAPDMGRAALETIKSRNSLNSVDPIYTLSRVATGLPKPLDSMMTKLADESWYVIKQEAIHYLEVRWRDDIYKVYEQKFAGRYPFDPRSSRDVSLQDFEAFFAPNGLLDRFYNDQLKMFIDENSNISGGHQEKSLIREDVLNQLEKARLIQDAFFNRKGILDVSFGVEPIRLTANKRRGVLNIDGQYLSYSHGPRNNVEVIWPNTLRDNTTSKVTLVPTEANESPRSISTEGPWALYRLLDIAKVVGASDTSVTYQFTVDDGDMEVKINATTSNPFTQRLFKNFELSETLY